jgi:hypothetical protein
MGAIASKVGTEGKHAMMRKTRVSAYVLLLKRLCWTISASKSFILFDASGRLRQRICVSLGLLETMVDRVVWSVPERSIKFCNTELPDSGGAPSSSRLSNIKGVR